MRRFKQWLGSLGAWNDSQWAIPELDRETELSVQRWTVVAGGLALVLSRLAPFERSARFGRTEQAYALIRQRLRQSRPVDASPELLSDVMHEVAEVCDPVTRGNLKACFRASRAGGTGDQGGAILPGGGESSSLQSVGSASSGRSSSASRLDNASTSIQAEMLHERAKALRKAIAAARSTGWADLG
jgi:hypothetical protein